MFTKTTLAAAAVATAITAGTATLPNAAAEAAQPQVNISIGFNTPNGYFQFGTGPGYGGPGYWGNPPKALSCNQAKNVLKSNYKVVNKIECNGPVYTFKTKKLFVGPWKTVKFNAKTGHYWVV